MAGYRMRDSEDSVQESVTCAHLAARAPGCGHRTLDVEVDLDVLSLYSPITSTRSQLAPACCASWSFSALKHREEEVAGRLRDCEQRTARQVATMIGRATMATSQRSSC